jgi:hypothetical protein
MSFNPHGVRIGLFVHIVTFIKVFSFFKGSDHPQKKFINLIMTAAHRPHGPHGLCKVAGW